MKRYLLPSLLILALGGAIAFAQQINKAVQLSQDASGAFGVDTNNNIYFPGHILTTGPGTPVLTGCGGGTPAIVGTDTAGAVTEGTSNNGCTVTFNRAYLATPYCLISWQATPPTTQTYTPSTTGIVVVHTGGSSAVFNYICSGSR